MCFLLQISKTFRSDPRLHSGSLLVCECGWQGKLREATEVRRFDRSGELISCHYVCRREECMKVLVEDPNSTPIPMVDVANKTWLPPRERKEQK